MYKHSHVVELTDGDYLEVRSRYASAHNEGAPYGFRSYWVVAAAGARLPVLELIPMCPASQLGPEEIKEFGVKFKECKKLDKIRFKEAL